jgi:hypothetical protein
MLDAPARDTRRMAAAALRGEAGERVERFADRSMNNGHRVVVCNGRANERKVRLGPARSHPSAQGQR